MKKLISGIAVLILLATGCSNETTVTKPSTAAISPSLSSSSTIYYLAINNNSPVPEASIPVANQTTMQQLLNAGEAKDSTKWNAIVSSNKVDLMRGGGIVDVLQRKDGLVQVRLHTYSEQGEDLSGQVRWTAEMFIQERQL